MGLEAWVSCDCVEKNRLKKPHRYPNQLHIGKNGSPEIRSVDPVMLDEHDAWMQLPPCRHDEMTVESSYLGNMGFVAGVRNTLASFSSLLPACPILLGKVLYSGTHTGDFLTVKQVESLAKELEQLKSVNLRRAGIPIDQHKPLRSITAELTRLAKTALKLRKPIAF